MQNRVPNVPMIPDFDPVPRKYRHDGWTEERQRAFIDALAETGSVKAAARQVNMSPEGAYYLRRQPGAESFAAAWLAALDHGMARIEDIAMERAINGVEVPVYSYGKLVGSRTVYNDRLLMFMLRNRRPDRFAAGDARLTPGGPAYQAAKKQWEAEKLAAPREGTSAREILAAKLREMRARMDEEKARDGKGAPEDDWLG